MPFPFFYAYPGWSEVSNATRDAIINSVQAGMADACWCLHGPEGMPLCAGRRPAGMRCSQCGYCSNHGDSLRKQAEMIRWLEAHGVNTGALSVSLPRPAADGMFLPHSVDRDSELVERIETFMIYPLRSPNLLCPWGARESTDRCSVSRDTHDGCDRCVYNMARNSSRKITWLFNYLKRLGVRFSAETTQHLEQVIAANFTFRDEESVATVGASPGEEVDSSREEDERDLAARRTDLPAVSAEEDFEGFHIPAGADWNAVFQWLTTGADVFCQPHTRCASGMCSSCLMGCNLGDTEAKRAAIAKYMVERLKVPEDSLKMKAPPEVEVDTVDALLTDLQQYLLERSKQPFPILVPGLLVCRRYPVAFSGQHNTLWQLVMYTDGGHARTISVRPSSGEESVAFGVSEYFSCAGDAALNAGGVHAVITLRGEAIRRVALSFGGGDIHRIITNGISGYSLNVLWCSSKYAMAEGAGFNI